MIEAKRPEDATLLDVLIDGFEKNEMLDGFHERVLPLRDAQLAKARFAALSEEVVRWKGRPVRRDEQAGWQLAAWADLELLQAGRAIAIRIKAPRFSAWWHEPDTWRGDAMQRLCEAWEQADAAACSQWPSRPHAGLARAAVVSRCASATPKAKAGAMWRVTINDLPSVPGTPQRPAGRCSEDPHQGKATNCVSNSDFLDRPSF